MVLHPWMTETSYSVVCKTELCKAKLAIWKFQHWRTFKLKMSPSRFSILPFCDQHAVAPGHLPSAVTKCNFAKSQYWQNIRDHSSTHIPHVIFEFQNKEASFNKTKKCNLVWIATSGSHLEWPRVIFPSSGDNLRRGTLQFIRAGFQNWVAWKPLLILKISIQSMC